MEKAVRWAWGLGLVLAAAPAGATPVSGVYGMVATAHGEASLAALDMLRARGTACDAAVAAAFALAVVEPYSSGIGGGGFALVRWRGKLTFLDFREVAPARARPDMYVRDGKTNWLLARDGPLAVAVPGAVAGYTTLHKRCGKLPLAQVLAPAVRLAREGFTVDLRYNGIAHSRMPELGREAEASRIFLVPGKDGTPTQPTIGHRIVQSDLAAVLASIAEDGGQSFYSGAIAQKLVHGLAARGGLLSEADLQGYQVRERAPLIGSYRGQAVATAPLPSAGGYVLLTLLNLMETQAKVAWHDANWLRLFGEGAKYAFADRALFGDPKGVSDAPARLDVLLSKKRARDLAARMGPRATAAAEIQAGTAAAPIEPTVAPPVREGEHTTHLSVVDAAGDAVALTTTVNFAWGSTVVVPGLGFLLNDEMDDFAASPGVPNAWRIVGSDANLPGPGKIPLSSMTPTFVFAGASVDSPLRLVVGSPGGARIPTTVAQIVLAVVDDNTDVRYALGLPRIHHQHLPDVLEMEPYALEPATVANLRAAGYVVEQTRHWCNAMAVAIDPGSGLRTAAADPRGVGVALAQ